MGLDFSHCDASWGYFGFMRFRKRLASMIGVQDIMQMSGYKESGGEGWPDDDPIVDLLVHSDCEGVLTPEECKAIGPRLREMVTPWSEDQDRANALLLCDGMDEAVKQDEELEFC